MPLRMRMYNARAEAFEAVCLGDLAEAAALAKYAVEIGEWQGVEVFDEQGAALHVEGVIPRKATGGAG